MITLLQTTKDAWGELIDLSLAGNFENIFDSSESSLEDYINANGVEEFLNELETACDLTMSAYTEEVHESSHGMFGSSLSELEIAQEELEEAFDKLKTCLIVEFPDSKQQIEWLSV